LISETPPDLANTVLGPLQVEALKVLPSQFVQNADRLNRFIQEARAASALNHPHVVSIYEIRNALRRQLDSGSAVAAIPAHERRFEQRKHLSARRVQQTLISSSPATSPETEALRYVERESAVM
jgi:serine/threonine protein kinase